MVAGGAAVPALAVNANHGTQVVSAAPKGFTPHVMDGAVLAIVQVGSEIVAGGTFTKVSPSATYSDTSDDVTRVGLFAFNAKTGVIDPNFNPTLGGGSPYAYALDTDGTNVYVGGPFASVGGSAAYYKLVKLTAAGVPDATFKAKPNSSVNDLVVRGPLVYIGGSFTSVFDGKKSIARSTLAAVSTADGGVSTLVNVPITGTYNGGTTAITKFDVNAVGTALTAVGNFSTVGGATHYQVATILTPPTTAAAVSGWSTDAYSPAKNSACAKVFNTFVRDIDYSPDGSYFVISATGAFGGGGNAGTMCDTVSRWESTGAGQVSTWSDYTGGDSTYGVAVTGAAVYVGGHMRWENNPFAGDAAGPGAVTRTGIAALDPVNGLPLSWNPSRSRDVGAKAMYATSQGLWVGSDGLRIANQIHARIALMPLAGGKVIATVPATGLPNTFFQPQPGTGGVLQPRPVDANGVPTTPLPVAMTIPLDWSTVRGAFMVNGVLYYGSSDGSLKWRTFNSSTGAAGAEQTVNLFDSPAGVRIPFPIANCSGMFYDTSLHRLYYTVSGDNNLYYRYFTPESQVVGAMTFTASTSTAFSTAAGLTLAGGKVFYGSTGDGFLRSVGYAGGAVTAGTPTVVSNDGTWRSRAIFAPNS